MLLILEQNVTQKPHALSSQSQNLLGAGGVHVTKTSAALLVSL